MRLIYLPAMIVLLPTFLFPFTNEEIEEFQRQSYEQVENNQAINAIYDGSLEELERIFSDDNLAVLDKKELRLLRNMI